MDGTAAHDWADAARQHTLTQAVTQFVNRKFCSVEIFFQQFVIAFSGRFHAHFAYFTGLGHVFWRNLDFFRLAILPFPGNHLADVDDAAEILAFTDRNLQRHDGLAEYIAHFFEGPEEIRVFRIHLVHIDHAGQLQFYAVVPRTFRIHFYA